MCCSGSEFDGGIMKKTDPEAIGELAQILLRRGVDPDTALNISLRTRRVTREMVAWLEENTYASAEEICGKARELHRKSIDDRLR